MAAVVAHVTGTALAPGVSRNGRLYTRDNIAKAVERAQARIADGKRPISMRSHHAAGDDSSRIVGRVTDMWQDPDTGAAKYRAAIADTDHGRNIARLTDDTDGQPQFLRGVSIRGAWMEEPHTEMVGDRSAETASDLEVSGLDFTGEPGVDDADVSHDRTPRAPGEAADESPYAIAESAPEALLSLPPASTVQGAPDAVTEKGAPPLKSGKPAAAPTKAPPGSYADPGYQDDKAKRYPLDSLAHARAAWSYVHQKDNAAKYTANQLKRIKGRIAAALKKYGVKVAAESETDTRYLVEPVAQITESLTLAECMGIDDDRCGSEGRYYISMTNGPTTVTISSGEIDPADLDLIGRAAMDGACKALATIDPDMDGDMDVPGAPAEDTDRDMDDAGAPVPGTRCPCRCGCAIPVEIETCPCACGSCETCGSTGAAETAPEAEAALAEASRPPIAPESAGESDQTPAPTPDADTAPETETLEVLVTETTSAAVEPSAAPAPAAAASVTLSADQFQLLLGALAARPVAETAPAPAPVAAPVTAAPAAPVAAAPVQPVDAAPAAPAPAVTETGDERMARMIAEAMATQQRTFIQDLVESGALPARRGLTPQSPSGALANPAAAVAEGGVNEYGMPAGAPNKPLHQYTTEELNKWAGPVVAEHAIGHYLHR